MENGNESNISLCPRCQQKIISTTKYCKNCGYDVTIDTHTEAVLSFGLKDSVVASSDSTTEITYSQQETPKIRLCKHIQNITLLLISLLGMFMLFMPIFNFNNMWAFITKMQDSGYKFLIDDFLAFDKNSTLFDLMPNLFAYLSAEEKLLNVSNILFYYELAIVTIVLVIIGLSIWLFIISIINSAKKKLNPKYYKGIVSALMGLSMLLIFTLNCLGIGPIIILVASFGSLVFYFIIDIISKERRFMVKHLIYKSISFVLLFILLGFSSFGLMNLNVDLGVNLFNFEAYPQIENIEKPNVFACQGIFLEFMMFIQCSSGDDIFTSVTLTLCILSFIAHLLYILFIELAIVALLRSLSKQSVRFPSHHIVLSTIAFYAFAIFAMLFNQIVNEAMFQKYVNSIGNDAFVQMEQFEVEQAKFYNRIFYLRGGMNVALFISLPICIYSIIAKSLCYKKSY